jgi:hypothetical protein
MRLISLSRIQLPGCLLQLLNAEHGNTIPGGSQYFALLQPGFGMITSCSRLVVNIRLYFTPDHMNYRESTAGTEVPVPLGGCLPPSSRERQLAGRQSCRADRRTAFITL